jgi:tetratricopeptide (TPR) repeat protein
MENLAQTLQRLIPRIRTLLQLTGLIAGLLVFFLTKALSGTSVLPLLLGGLIAVCLLYFSLIPNIIEHFPRGDRARLITTLFGMFCALFALVIAATLVFVFMSTKAIGAEFVSTMRERLNERVARLEARDAEIKHLQDIALSENDVTEWIAFQKERDSLASQKSNILRMVADPAQEQDILKAFKSIGANNGTPFAGSMFQRDIIDAMAEVEGDAKTRVIDGRIYENRREAAQLLFLRAHMGYARGNDQEAIKDLRSSISIQPSFAAILSLASLLEATGAPDQAAEAITAFLDHKNEPLSEVENKYLRSQRAFYKWLAADGDETSLDPTIYSEDVEIIRQQNSLLSADVLFGIGVVYSFTGRYAQANASFQKEDEILTQYAAAKGVKPESLPAYGELLFQKAVNANIQGNYQIARETNERARAVLEARQPVDPRTVLNLEITRGQILAEFGAMPEAIQVATEALSNAGPLLGVWHRQYAEALRARGDILRDAGKLGDALTDCDTAVDVLTKTLENRQGISLLSARLCRGLTLAMLGRGNDAKHDLEEAGKMPEAVLRNSTVWPKFRLLAVKIHISKGQIDEAKQIVNELGEYCRSAMLNNDFFIDAVIELHQTLRNAPGALRLEGVHTFLRELSENGMLVGPRKEKIANVLNS